MVGSGVQRTFSSVKDSGTSGHWKSGGGMAKERDVAVGEGVDAGGEV